MTTLQKLQTKYANSEGTKLYAAGKFDEAARFFGKSGMWGLFEECRTNKEVSADDARAALLAEITAARKAKFSK